jgi:hypothetical protein
LSYHLKTTLYISIVSTTDDKSECGSFYAMKMTISYELLYFEFHCPTICKW